jgi:hypothetical protein
MPGDFLNSFLKDAFVKDFVGLLVHGCLPGIRCLCVVRAISLIICHAIFTRKGCRPEGQTGRVRTRGTALPMDHLVPNSSWACSAGISYGHDQPGWQCREPYAAPSQS